MRVRAGLLASEAATWFGPKVALTSVSGQEVTGSQTFAEVNRAGNKLGSGLLALGAERGDRVGVLAYNTPEVFHAWLGFEKHNLVRAVLHSHFGMEAHVWSLDHIEASTLMFDTRFTKDLEAHRGKLKTVRHFIAIGPNPPDWAVPYAEVVAAGSADEPQLDVDEDAACFLQFTSGTTGNPKPWVKTYRSWAAVIDHNLHHFDTFGPDIPAIREDDVNLHFHALQWATGFQTLYPYWIRGARSVLLDDAEFNPDVVLDTIAREGVTGTFAPGPLWAPILDAIEARGGIDHQLRRVVIFFGTAEMLDRTTELIGPVWAHGFGSTEQGAVTTRLLPSDLVGHPERRTSVGRTGSPFFEVSIKDPEGNPLGAGEVGEIAVRSAMSQGDYWGMPEKTAEARFPDDWFRPYDVGYLDADGFLYYSDRAGDTIFTSSGAVYPHLVESALARHEAVANTGVVGLGEPGEQVVVAAVQLKPGRESSDELAETILTQTCAQLPEHERPARVVFVDQLPTVLGGAKVQRAALREQLVAR
jgi:acyl-coenzyme A synthetase/AMP-(fatty) acid ligase